jgi:hypothetical protein
MIAPRKLARWIVDDIAAEMVDGAYLIEVIDRIF